MASVYKRGKLTVTARLHSLILCVASCGKLIKLLNATLCYSTTGKDIFL